MRPAFKYDDDRHVIVEHDCRDGRVIVYLDVTIEHAYPLTVAERIACSACGLHGHIRDGGWVPARRPAPIAA